MPNLTAKQFISALEAQGSPEKVPGYERSFKTANDAGEPSDTFIGVSMGKVFALAKTFVAMPLLEIERVLESPIHEARVGGVSIMDFQARSKKTSETSRRELFELYLRRHDRINNWDLVDRAAPHVVGGYLVDKSRDILYKLSRSANVWERRTAMVSTYYFIRQNDLDDTFNIAEVLLHDELPLIHTAVGGWLREAGKRDRPRLLGFLNRHAASMPRIALRFALEHLEQSQREHYLNLRKGTTQ